MLKWLLMALAVCGVLLLWRSSTHSKRGLPQVNARAPDLSLADQHGRLRTCAEFLGRWLVLYFYPRDDTPACAEQAARFRDAMAEFEALGAAVCGVSVDSGASHAAFARKLNLGFTLLADPQGAVAARYGSLRRLGFIRVARRNTFLIDPQGRVVKVYLGVNPSRNAREVAEDLRRLATP